MKRLVPTLLLVGGLGVAALAAGDPDAIDLGIRLAPPSLATPLGTDHLGRDVAARIVAGGVAALAVVALASAVAFAGGLLGGALLVVAPPSAADALRRVVDLALAVPGLVLALVIAALVGLTPVAGGLALAVQSAAGNALVAAGLLSTAFAATHVRAAEALGGSKWHVLRRHVLPAVLPALVLLQCYDAARLLLAWSALTFLGLGADTSRPDLGAMIWEYRLFLFDHPRLVLAPAAVIALVAWVLSALGDGDRDAGA